MNSKLSLLTIWLAVGIGFCTIVLAQNEDPCVGGPCGKGARCHANAMLNLVVCTCNDDTVGDPFEECKPLPGASSTAESSTTERESTPGTTVTAFTTTTAKTTTEVSTASAVQSTESQLNAHHPSDGHPSLPIGVNDGGVYAFSNAGYPNNYNPNTPVIIPTAYNQKKEQVQPGQQELKQKPENQYPQQSSFATSLDVSTDLYKSPSPTDSLHKTTNAQSDTTQNSNHYNSPTTTVNTPTPQNPNYYSSSSPMTVDLHRNNHYATQRVSEIIRTTPAYEDTYVASPTTRPVSDRPNYYPTTQNSFAQTFPDRAQGHENVHYNSHSSNHHISSSNNYNDNNQYAHGVHGQNHGNGQQGHYQHHYQHHNSHSGVKDPMGQYTNCKIVNNIVACADTSVSEGDPSGSFQHRTHHQHADNNEDYYPAFSNKFQHHSYPSKPHLDINNIKGHFANVGSDYHEHGFISSGNVNGHSDRGGSQGQHKVQPMEPTSSSSNELCKKLCGINSVCRIFLGRPVCGCPEGHSGDASVMCTKIEAEKKNSSCQRHTECTSNEICMQSVCVDPCAIPNTNKNPSEDPFKRSNYYYNGNGSMCGNNAKCLVVEHTPLCACNDGFYGNPYVSCVA